MVMLLSSLLGCNSDPTVIVAGSDTDANEQYSIERAGC